MGRFIDTKLIDPPSDENNYEELVAFADKMAELTEDEYISFTLCEHCERCIERGGHANCRGYLYCTLHKTQVTESDGCTWGRER